jgi:hypothetical protein
MSAVLPLCACPNVSVCLVLGQVVSAAPPVPAQCGARTAQEAGGKHYLKAGPSTVKWGYFFENTKPAMVVGSGSEVTVEMITHHAGDGKGPCTQHTSFSKAVTTRIATSAGSCCRPLLPATGNFPGQWHESCTGRLPSSPRCGFAETFAHRFELSCACPLLSCPAAAAAVADHRSRQAHQG